MLSVVRQIVKDADQRRQEDKRVTIWPLQEDYFFHIPGNDLGPNKTYQALKKYFARHSERNKGSESLEKARFFAALRMTARVEPEPFRQPVRRPLKLPLIFAPLCSKKNFSVWPHSSLVFMKALECMTIAGILFDESPCFPPKHLIAFFVFETIETFNLSNSYNIVY